MIGLIRDRMDKYLGRGRHSIAVPVMDGPLHPNRGLDNAEALFSLDPVDASEVPAHPSNTRR